MPEHCHRTAVNLQHPFRGLLRTTHLLLAQPPSLGTTRPTLQLIHLGLKCHPLCRLVERAQKKVELKRVEEELQQFEKVGSRGKEGGGGGTAGQGTGTLWDTGNRMALVRVWPLAS